jgi:hypothetical protein
MFPHLKGNWQAIKIQNTHTEKLTTDSSLQIPAAFRARNFVFPFVI